MTMKRLLLLAPLALIALACGESDEGSNAPAPDGGAAPADWTLKADPGDALSVIEAHTMKPGQTVRVVGRISNIVDGFATFNLVDDQYEWCGRTGEDHCETPWDYCCVLEAKEAERVVLVEAHDASGTTAETESLGLRLLDLVVVEGTLAKDEHGTLSVIATGWFRRDRPELSPDLKWPGK